ncbi:MAG: hypothetical protein ACOC8F_02860 [Planctomycetota bacterium]
MLLSDSKRIARAAWVCILAIPVAACGGDDADRPGEPAARFNIPRAVRPPEITGRIDEDAWAGALEIRGLTHAHVPTYADAQIRRWILTNPTLRYADRDTRFRLMWDAEHLYVAARSAVPEGLRLGTQFRGRRYAPTLIHDDAYEFAVDASGIGPERRSASGALLCILNALGAGQYRTIPPDFRPYGRMPRARVEPEVTSEVWRDETGMRWWDMQVALDLEDLGLTGKLRSGDRIGVSMGRIFEYPWRYARVPATGTYMDAAGLPVGTLVDHRCHVRIADLAGLDEGKLDLRGRVVNPSDEARRVELVVRVRARDADTEKPALTQTRTLDVPARGEQALTVRTELPVRDGVLDVAIRRSDADDAPPLWAYRLAFSRRPPRSPYRYVRPDPDLPLDCVAFDRRSQRLVLQADTLTAKLADRQAARAMTYAVRPRGSDDPPVVEGRTEKLRNFRFEAEVDLSGLPRGEYEITGALVDEAGEVLVRRTLKGFDRTVDADGPRTLWWCEVSADGAARAATPVAVDLEPVAEKLNRWYGEGRAAGNLGDFYHNHDHLHSYLRTWTFPQVTPIDMTDAGRSLVGAGLQVRKLFTGRVIGNASMVHGCSLPEYAYRRPGYVDALYRQYTNNHVYLYPSHTTGPQDYSAYTPYVVATVGSSGSEQRHMQAFFASLAALRPRVKARLTEAGLIAPVLQMLLRRHYGDVASDEAYFTAAAHPVSFKGSAVGMEAMVDHAQRLRAGALPAMVRLEVLAEDFGLSDAGEKLFTTPGAIARALRGEGRRTIRLSAADSVTLNDRKLRWRWVLLRGDPERTGIEVLDESGATAVVRVEPQARRVDVAVIADNGVEVSAPAILSIDASADDDR